LCILALEPIRRRFYELFRLAHMLYIPAIVFLIFHVDGAGWGFIPGALLYGIVNSTFKYCVHNIHNSIACLSIVHQNSHV
jgi:hypothetical protein